MNAVNSSVRTVVMVMLVGIGASCASDTTQPLGLTCSEPAPSSRADGSWRGQLAGRELLVTLREECSLFSFYTFWSVAGTWTWGGVSSGTAVFLAPKLSLKANPGENTFRGLTITVNETPPYNSTITGLAEGELPISSSQTGAWQTLSNEPVALIRQ